MTRQIDSSSAVPPEGSELHDRLSALAEGLTQAFEALLHDAVGDASELRPVRLTSVLGLDKSLASRVARALRAADPMEALHELPTPQGLAIVREAASGAGASRLLLEAAREMEERYGALLSEFSGGRADLDTALAAWLPELRARSLRRARRDVFRGNAMVSGIRSDGYYAAYFLLPGARPGDVDAIWLSARQGLRRLRFDLPVHIAGIVSSTGEEVDTRASIHGEPVDGDPRRFLVPSRTTLEREGFQLRQARDRMLLVLAGDAPAVNHPVDVTLAGLAPALHGSRRSESQSHIWFDFISRQPTERAVLDVFVHDDLGLTAAPVTTRIVEGLESYGRGSSPDDLGPGAVDAEWQMRPLRRGLAGLRTQDVRDCPGLVQLVCDARNVQLDDLRGFRLREDFPMPTMRTAVWIELPESD